MVDEMDDIVEDEEELFDDDGLVGMDDDELKSAIEAEIRESVGYDDDLVSASRASAMDYYLNAPRGDEVDGRSQVQSSDVADAVEWTVPELVRIFSDPSTCTFTPSAPGREGEADQQTKAVRKFIYGSDGPTLLFYQWFKDALLQRNGLVKVYWSTKTRIKTDIYSGLSDAEFQALQQQQHITNIEVAERQVERPTPPEMAQRFMQQAAASGIPPHVAQQQLPPTVTDTVYDARVVRQIPANEPVFDPVPPEEFLVNGDHNSVLLDGARFVCHVRPLSRSDLVAMGYDKGDVDQLPAWSSDKQYDEEYHARDQLQENWTSGQSSDNGDPSADEIECHDCYVCVDYDGDGIAERRHVFMAGGRILENEYWDEQPFCAISPFVLPHKFYGQGLYDRLREVQDIKTALLRQWLDNLYLSNNSRTEAVIGQVNLDDLLTSRPGGVVRVKAPGMLREIVLPQIGDSAMQALAYQDKVRGERSGVNPDQKTEGIDIGGSTAHGIERLMTAKEELQWIIGKIFGETGVRQLFLKTRDVLAHNRKDPMQIQEGEGWTSVNPAEWSNETSCVVNVGAGIGERQRKIGALVQLHTMQMQLMENPNTATLVNPIGVYGLLEDIQRLGDIDPQQSYFVDPMSQQGQQAAQQQQQMQQVFEQANQQMQQMQMQLQQALAQAELQKSQAATAQAETKRLETQLKALKEARDQGLDERKLAQDDAQHLDDLSYKYTELEVENKLDIPGRGMGQ